jgi:hypothetical protein
VPWSGLEASRVGTFRPARLSPKTLGRKDNMMSAPTPHNAPFSPEPASPPGGHDQAGEAGLLSRLDYASSGGVYTTRGSAPVGQGTGTSPRERAEDNRSPL